MNLNELQTLIRCINNDIGEVKTMRKTIGEGESEYWRIYIVYYLRYLEI